SATARPLRSLPPPPRPEHRRAAPHSRPPSGLPGIGGPVPVVASPRGPGPTTGRRPLMDVKPMWAPSPERVERANLTRYLRWLRDRRGLAFGSYDERWGGSGGDLGGVGTR